MDIRFVAVTAVAAFWTAPSPAQTVVAPGVSPMERVQREADGPRRRILEASRTKPAPKAAEAAPALASLPGAGAPLVVAAEDPLSAVPPVEAPDPPTIGAVLLDLPPPPPRLLSRVEPEVPARLIARGAAGTEVVVEMLVNRDGSVSGVAVRPAADAELDAIVVEAVRQWRYEAQPEPRPLQVHLLVAPG